MVSVNLVPGEEPKIKESFKKEQQLNKYISHLCRCLIQAAKAF